MNASWLSGKQRGDPVKMICTFKSPISPQSLPVNMQKWTSPCVYYDSDQENVPVVAGRALGIALNNNKVLRYISRSQFHVPSFPRIACFLHEA